MELTTPKNIEKVDSLGSVDEDDVDGMYDIKPTQGGNVENVLPNNGDNNDSNEYEYYDDEDQNENDNLELEAQLYSKPENIAETTGK